MCYALRITLNPCVPPLPVFGTLCLTEWPTLHSSLLGSTAKVFCPFCPVLAYYALGRTPAGMSACKPCCPGWCLLRAHCSSGFPGTATCVPAPTEHLPGLTWFCSAGLCDPSSTFLPRPDLTPQPVSPVCCATSLCPAGLCDPCPLSYLGLT